MTQPVHAADNSARSNPMVWMIIALPALAVVASLTSYALALTRGDPELPAAYHWEGSELAADETRGAAAATLGIQADLQIDAATGSCRVTLRGARPAALRLAISHPTVSGADQLLTLTPVGSAGVYAAPCPPLSAAHWWVQLADDRLTWQLRARGQGTLQQSLTLRAARPAAAPAS